MNYPVTFGTRNTSYFLQSELDRLQKLSDDIRNSGSVAPGNCWIVEKVQRKGMRTYNLMWLVSENKDVKSRSLGRPNSAQVLDWRNRCSRRDALIEIEQQAKILTDLIDRQFTHPIEVVSD